MKNIAVITTSRSDFGIYRPILKRIEKSKKLNYFLVVSGTHLSHLHGYTVSEIEKEGFVIGEKGEVILTSDSEESIVKSMALSLLFFADVYKRRKPDIVMVLGDRFEMHQAALAALPFNIMVAHIHGGELSFGAIDDSLRHSITKLSHIHFVSTEEYKKRVVQLGEKPENVVVCGAPSLDNLKHIKLLTKNELKRELGINLDKGFILVTLHPETRGKVDNKRNAEILFESLREFDFIKIVSLPNADSGGLAIRSVIEEFKLKDKNVFVFENLGTKLYFSLMKYALAMIGNSSSGIIESATFKLPVVNVGDRQKGRARNLNVIDCDFEENAIKESIKTALSKPFLEKIAKIKNIYGDGNASERIVTFLEKVDLGKVKKEFYDLR